MAAAKVIYNLSSDSQSNTDENDSDSKKDVRHAEESDSERSFSGSNENVRHIETSASESEVDSKYFEQQAKAQNQICDSNKLVVDESDGDSSDSDHESQDDLLLQIPIPGEARDNKSGASASKVKSRHFGGRYFEPMDISFKCHNCHEVGHMLRDCPKPRLNVCILCAGDHIARDCPREVCRRCLRSGHQYKNCPNAMLKLWVCSRCGGDHKSLDCGRFRSSTHSDAPDDREALASVRCYVCGARGHLSCGRALKKTRGADTCPNCAEAGHLADACPQPLLDPHFNIEFSAAGQTCFHCHKLGHLARECPDNSLNQAVWKELMFFYFNCLSP
jgi:hypothetical protein